MITQMRGVLEIDHERGVIYFHLEDVAEVIRRGIATPLRICSLPKIPEIQQRSLDITHMRGQDWENDK